MVCNRERLAMEHRFFKAPLHLHGGPENLICGAERHRLPFNS